MRASALPLFAFVMMLAGCGGDAASPPPPARAVTPIAPGSTGEISGVAVFEGPPPPEKFIKMGGTPECSGGHKNPVRAEDLLVKDGKLINAFVHVRQGLEKFVFAVPEAPVQIDQKGCVFGPHVVGVQVGQPLEMLNSDAILHNLHSLPKNQDGWNLGFPFQGVKQMRRVDKPEVMIEYKCDVHGWMKGFIGAVDHPFFQVTGDGGAFSWKGVPSGELVLEAWHETLGVQTQQVTLKPGEKKSVTFTFRPVK